MPSHFVNLAIASASNAGTTFVNSRHNDVLMYAENSNQAILIGQDTTAHAPLTITPSNITVATHVVPSVNEAYDLGASNLRFKDLYLSGSTINLGGTKISTNAQGGFELRDDSNVPIAVFKKPEAASSNYFVFDPEAGKVQLYDPVTQNIISAGGSVEGLSNALGAVFVLQGSNLGVGTSNPQTPLHVIGNTRFDGDIQLANNTSLNLTRLKVFKPTGGATATTNITTTVTSVPGIAPQALTSFDLKLLTQSQTQYRFLDNGSGVSAVITNEGSVRASSVGTSSNNPSFSFMSDPDTGFYNPAPGTIGISTDGQQIGRVDKDALTMRRIRVAMMR